MTTALILGSLLKIEPDFTLGGKKVPLFGWNRPSSPHETGSLKAGSNFSASLVREREGYSTDRAVLSF
jgi:hypothetical protein